MTGMRRAVLVSAGWIAAASAFGVAVSLWRSAPRLTQLARTLPRVPVTLNLLWRGTVP